MYGCNTRHDEVYATGAKDANARVCFTLGESRGEAFGNGTLQRTKALPDPLLDTVASSSLDTFFLR